MEGTTETRKGEGIHIPKTEVGGAYHGGHYVDTQTEREGLTMEGVYQRPEERWRPEIGIPRPDIGVGGAYYGGHYLENQRVGGAYHGGHYVENQRQGGATKPGREPVQRAYRTCMCVDKRRLIINAASM
jgi:hypothetical protein